MKKKSFFVPIILLLTSILIPTVIAQNPIQDLLSVFQDFNLVEVYFEYQMLIDFFLYTIIFVSIARLTIGQKFEGRAGKSLVTVIGIILALGLSIWTSSRNFNIGGFGPFAAIIFISVVAVAAFALFKQLGAEVAWAGAAAFIIIYFSFRLIFPDLWEWLDNIPLLKAGLSIAVLVSIFVVIIGLFKKIRGTFEGLRGEGRDLGDFLRRKKKEDKEDEAESKEAEHITKHDEVLDNKDRVFLRRLGKSTIDSIESDKNLLQYLQNLITVLDEHGYSEKTQVDEETANKIAEKIALAIGTEKYEKAKQNEVTQTVNRIGRIARKEYVADEELKRTDKRIKDNHLTSPDAQKMIGDVNKKLHEDEKIREYANYLRRVERDANRRVNLLISSINSAYNSANKGNIAKARNLLKEAADALEGKIKDEAMVIKIENYIRKLVIAEKFADKLLASEEYEFTSERIAPGKK